MYADVDAKLLLDVVARAKVPGDGGYRYFGAARDLPGVRELFEAVSLV